MAFRHLLESLTEPELLYIDGSTRSSTCSLTRYRAADAGALRLVDYGDVEHLEAADAEPIHEEPHGAGPGRDRR